MPNFTEAMTVVALLGTGGVLGSWVNEWRRARREDRLRWQGERRATYERFITAVDNLRGAELDLAEYVGQLRDATDWGIDPLFDVEDLLQRADELQDSWSKYAVAQVRILRQTTDAGNDQVDAALATIEMLATPSVAESGATLVHELTTVAQVAEQYPPRKCGGWSEPLVEASQRVSDARRHFIDSVRKELGVG